MAALGPQQARSAEVARAPTGTVCIIGPGAGLPAGVGQFPNPTHRLAFLVDAPFDGQLNNNAAVNQVTRRVVVVGGPVTSAAGQASLQRRALTSVLLLPIAAEWYPNWTLTHSSEGKT